MYTDIPAPKEMSKNIANAWRKGYAAFLNDETAKNCPYMLSRMARAYYYAWINGWEMAKSETAVLSD